MPGGLNGPPVLNGAAYVYPTKTLAQLRADVLVRLGFITRMTGMPTKTRLQLRNALIETLGFPDPMTAAAPRTLLLLKGDVSRALGFGQTVLPPGMNDYLDLTINEAQQRIFRRLEMDKGGVSPPARMDDADSTTIDYVPVQILAIALAKAHYGQMDAKAYFDQLEQYFADLVRRRPPNLDDIVNRFLKEAQETVYRRYELGTVAYALTAFEADGDSTTIDYRPVLAMATGDVKAHYGQKDFKRYYDEVNLYFSDLYKRVPPGASDVVNSILQDAQLQLYFRYSVMRIKRWWSWTTTTGSRFYDVIKDGTLNIDWRKVEGVWIQDGSSWSPLTDGINPRSFDYDANGVPTNYELREYLELWPAPATSTYKIWLFGDIGLKPFTADADVATVDYDALFLLALGNAKAHWNQRDAPLALQQFERHIGRLNAASFGRRRYFPNSNTAGLVFDGPRGVDYGMNVRREEDGGVRRMEDG